MKILLTGDTGYIGSQMKLHLQEAGHEVVGLDTDYFYWCALGVINPEKHVRIIKDVRRVTSKDLVGFDAVVHLAALSNDPMGDINEELTQEINLEASVDLAILAKNAGVSRFVFASSCSVYGDGGGLEVCTEESPINPLTAYAKSKALAEVRIGLLADRNFAPTFMRNATVYGVSPRLRTDLIVNAMTARAYTNREILVYGDGNLWRPLVHISDLCEAFLQVLESPRDVINKQIINVGMDEDNFRVVDVAKIVQEEVNGTKITFIPQSADARSYKVGFSKLFEILPEYVSIYDVRTGVRELVDLFRDYEAVIERNLEPDFFTSDKYIRLKHLKKLMDSGQIDKYLHWK